MNQIFDLNSAGGAVVGDLEMEITDLDKEISYLTKELKRAERLAVQGQKYQQLWRDHLDDSPIEEDNDQEAEVRQLDWNALDTKKLIKAQADGYDINDRESVPF